MYLKACQQMCDSENENYIGKNKSCKESCENLCCLFKSISGLILSIVGIVSFVGILMLFGMLGSAIINSNKYDLSTGCPHGVNYNQHSGKCENKDEILMCTAKPHVMIVVCPITYGIITPIIIFVAFVLLIALFNFIIIPISQSIYEFCIVYYNLVNRPSDLNQVDNNNENINLEAEIKLTKENPIEENQITQNTEESSSNNSHISESSEENDDIKIELENLIN